MQRYICIHGHFYQPPRENPWLEFVEIEDGAAPYHDWNQRITDECYARNATARILDNNGWVDHIVNNYARISFNFGPTLMSWLEANSAETYRAVLAADKESARRFGGHGSAIAQSYNHLIMPLATPRDRRTQVIWGARDFEHRFGRVPEGMWLPETAVDVDTLECLAEQGIAFTLLGPQQLRRIRPIGGDRWEDTPIAGIDPSRPYRVSLPSGRFVTVFVYDHQISQDLAFSDLLTNGDRVLARLMEGFRDDRAWAQLVSVASDGETYGHHHRFADMALAYVLHRIDDTLPAELVNFGAFLELHPPTHEAQIVENTSWSCAHGVERWRSDCGCSTWSHPGWSQSWRRPLREALDWLRDELQPVYELEAGRLLDSPWAARDDYIEAVLDGAPEHVDAFLDQHAAHPLDAAERVAVLTLLEVQRQLQLMYTSCGWFFDDVSGIETIQVLQYAGRAIQLVPAEAARRLRDEFLRRLELARSNDPLLANARHVYEKSVAPAMIDLEGVAAHYAITSIFHPYTRSEDIHAYSVTAADHRWFEAGRARMVLGRAVVTSRVTRESADLAFGAVHLGDHNVIAAVHDAPSSEEYRAMVADLSAAFQHAEILDAVRRLDRHFGSATYSLKALFRDDQRRILDQVLDSTLAEVEANYRDLYEDHAPLLRFLADIHSPIPPALRQAAEFVLNLDLERAFEAQTIDPDRVKALVDETLACGAALDTARLSFAAGTAIARLADEFRADPLGIEVLERFERAVTLARFLQFSVDLWRAQNAFYEVFQADYAERLGAAKQGSTVAQRWVSTFQRLGLGLTVRIG
ncbi:MAG TPA: DUF3536 domain-containing protein [Thermomicrobiaceae bacterium]|nr:DUF3536 domain-containing protein [Thermomicrobiaceae bacterium]